MGDAEKRREEERMLAQLQEEAQVFETVYGFFTCCLTLRDEEAAASYLTPWFHVVGPGEQDVHMGRQAFRKVLGRHVQMVPQPLPFWLTGWEHHAAAPGFHVCFAYLELWDAMPNGEEQAIRVRMSAALHREGERYLLDSIHVSRADPRQEEGAFLLPDLEEQGGMSRQTGQELQRIVAQVMPGGVVGSYAEEGFPLYVANQKMLRMMGYGSLEELRQETGGLMLESIHPEDREFVGNLVDHSFRTGEQYEIQYRLRRRDGSYIWVYDIGRKTVDEEGRGAIISVIIDISQQMNTRQHLEKELARDFLTGVYNRKGGEERISRALQQGEEYLFLMIDLDNFKQVNDIYGHAQGDRALQYVAREMDALFSQPDVVCRLGGDEFTIFISPCSHPEQAEEKLGELGERYARMMEEYWPLAHSTLSVGGIYGSQPLSFGQLYKMADQLLYQVKQEKKGRVKLRQLWSFPAWPVQFDD